MEWLYPKMELTPVHFPPSPHFFLMMMSLSQVTLMTVAVSKQQACVDKFTPHFTVSHVSAYAGALWVSTWGRGEKKKKSSQKWPVADACWECGGQCRSMWPAWVGDQGWEPGWPLVQSSMPIDEKNQVIQQARCQAQSGRGEKKQKRPHKNRHLPLNNAHTHNPLCFGHMSSFSKSKKKKACSFSFNNVSTGTGSATVKAATHSFHASC